MMDEIGEEVMKRCNNYFRDVYMNAPASAQEILYCLSHKQVFDADRASLRWLKRRLLIDDDTNLTIPIFGRWIRVLSEAY
jgi:hypothetical protein